MVMYTIDIHSGVVVDRLLIIVLSHAGEVGSPTNHPGSRQRQDTGPGILWSVNRWTKPDIYFFLKRRMDRTLDLFYHVY